MNNQKIQTHTQKAVISADEHLENGLIAYQSGDHQKTVELLTMSIQTCETSTPQHQLLAHVFRAKAYIWLKNYDSANEDAQKCLALKSDDQYSIGTLFEVYYAQKKFSLCKQVLQYGMVKCTEKDQLELQMEKLKKAEKFIKIETVTIPDGSIADAQNQKLKGNDFWKENKLDKALACYEKAISLNPNELFFHLNKAAALTEMAEYDQALQTLWNIPNEALFNCRPYKIGKLHFRRAVIYYEQQMYHNALVYFQMADQKLPKGLQSKGKKKLEHCKKAIFEQSLKLKMEHEALTSQSTEASESECEEEVFQIIESDQEEQ